MARGFGSGALAITTRQVLHEGWPILLVTHDADDGVWQFVNGHGDTEDADSALVTEVQAVLTVDSSIADLADLPLGGRAWRETAAAPWRRDAR